MDLTDLDTVKSLLGRYGLRPRKYLGQHFLIDREVLREIADAAEISKTDFVLEIGPGIGVLTMELARRAKKIFAVEKDPKIAGVLENTLKQGKIENVEVIVGDVLKNTGYRMPNAGYKIVANLPYYLTSAVIRKFLEDPPAGGPPNEMTLMVQKEVAERICGQPPRMNLLAVSVQFYAKPEIIAFVSKKSFWPQPEVDSAIIKISNLKPQIPKNLTKIFFKVVRAGFSAPRKKLANNLAKILPELTQKKINDLLRKIGLRPDCRSQDLSVDNWQKLVSIIGKNII